MAVLWHILSLATLAAASTYNTSEILALCTANQDNLTALDTILAPPWVDSPQIRGTSTILWSCLLTIVACVYTALHLNVPQQRGFWPLLAIKGKWVLTALLAPELMIYVSATQFLNARWLRKELRGLLKLAKESREELSRDTDSLPAESAVDLRLCFFITMGAVQIRVGDVIKHNMKSQEKTTQEQQRASESLATQRQTLTLSPNGVCQLLQMGHWIPITSDIIDDKSKANLFQKALVLLQVVWFATQCIARKCYGLPISLLELHTVIHVVSAGVMYGFWFKKPLDIREPEVLGDLAGETMEAMARLSLLSKNLRRQLHRLVFYGASDISETVSPLNASSFAFDRSYSVEYVDPKPSEGINLRTGQAMSCGIGVLSGDIDLSANDVTHLACVAKYISQMRPLPKRKRLSDIIADLGGDYFDDAPVLIQISPNRNLYIDSDDPDSSQERLSGWKAPWMGLAFCLELTLSHWTNAVLALLFPALYGGIHLTAWNSTFPTFVEHVLWKVACFIIIAGIPSSWIAVGIGLTFSSVGDSLKSDLNYTRAKGLLIYVSMTLCFICIGIFVAIATCMISARLFVIVESFISLRSAPIGVFWTPSWIQMLPHG